MVYCKECGIDVPNYWVIITENQLCEFCYEEQRMKKVMNERKKPNKS